MSLVPRTLQGAPELSAAEREALAVLAEHARERARLDCVWLFTHTPDPASESDLELVAHARGETSAALAEAAARAAVARAARGERRRFNRGRGAETAGTRVATATGATSAVSAAGQPGGTEWTPGAEAVLAELAAVALRLTSGPAESALAGELAAAETATASAAAADEPAAPAPATRTRGAPEPAFGTGLAASMALLEQPPILPESRTRLAAALGRPRGALADLVQTIETDIGLALAVIARANAPGTRPRGGIVSIPEAVELLGPKALGDVLDSLPLLRAPATGDRVSAALARITPHSIATRSAADLLATRVGAADRDAVRLAAVLHDIGKVALSAASAAYLERALDPSATPGDRATRERRALGIDHAGLGAIALGRLGIPRRVAGAVERHHADDADGSAAVIRLADMLAHEARGNAVDDKSFTAAGDALGVRAADLRDLAYELAREGGPRAVGGEPSPLTPMQQKVLVGLRRGLTYKQIAIDLQVSESTVRSHLHKTYERLGVVDRAQAVLLAQDRGWI